MLSALSLPAHSQWNPLIRKHLWGLKVMGFIVFEDQRFHKLHVFRGLFFSLTFLLFNFTQMVDLIQNELTIDSATTLLFTTTVARFYDFYANRKEFFEIISECDVNVRQMQREDVKSERPIVQEETQYVNKLTVFFWTCALITANSMNIHTLLEWYLEDNPEETVMPSILGSWLPVSATWDNFFVYYSVHFYVMWVGMLIVPCWHAFIAALMIYVILELKLLKHRFANFEEYLHPHHTDEDVYAFLVKCVKKQARLKMFVNKLVRLISQSVFLDFVIYSALICALLYNIATTSSSVEIFITICYIGTMTMILWMYHWHAHLISVNVRIRLDVDILFY